MQNHLAPRNHLQLLAYDFLCCLKTNICRSSKNGADQCSANRVYAGGAVR